MTVFSGNWGTGAWGQSPWGGLSTTSPAFGAVFASGDRRIYVNLDAAPQMVSPNAPGDALNPKTWTVTVPSTGAVYTVLSVAAVSAAALELLLLEELPTHFVTVLLETSTLRNAAGIPIPSEISATFQGVRLEATSTVEKRTVRKGNGARDIANPPTPNSPVGGALEINSGGDYMMDEGDALLRKLVIRRLMSTPGDFFHLPDYGLGLREKEPLPFNDIRALKRAIVNEITKEPDIEGAEATVTLGPDTVFIQLRVKSRASGTSIEFGIPIRQNVANY